MIKTLSPYYLNIPLVAPLSLEVCSSFTLQIFVWNGIKTDVPATPIYEITKDNPALFDGSEEINIGLLINDYIEFSPNFSDATELVNGNNQLWCKTQVLYTTSDEDDYVPNFQQTHLLLQGYGYGLEGKNTQLPTDNILLQGREFKVNRGGKFVFPFLIQEPTDESELVLESVTLVSGSNYSYSFTSNFTFTQLYSQVFVGVWSTPVLFLGNTSPQTRIISGGTITRIYAFNEATGNIVYSNEFEFIP